MSWLDNFLSSSAIVWIVLAVIGLNFYLRRKGKTFPEFVKELIEWFKEQNNG